VQKGHFFVVGSDGRSRRERETSAFTGLTTKKKTAAATRANESRPFRNWP
jgi:hypothetical protein